MTAVPTLATDCESRVTPAAPGGEAKGLSPDSGTG